MHDPLPIDTQTIRSTGARADAIATRALSAHWTPPQTEPVNSANEVPVDRPVPDGSAPEQPVPRLQSVALTGSFFITTGPENRVLLLRLTEEERWILPKDAMGPHDRTPFAAARRILAAWTRLPGPPLPRLLLIDYLEPADGRVFPVTHLIYDGGHISEKTFRAIRTPERFQEAKAVSPAYLRSTTGLAPETADHLELCARARFTGRIAYLHNGRKVSYGDHGRNVKPWDADCAATDLHVTENTDVGKGMPLGWRKAL
ncbi:hypothetical protein AB0469_25900 [Streptomyces sp. NPDC093801]|uniref:hypothetical protein n=1 Tax=Streptomyces sp. NPDC093801 TaxID=3155203 RepID=UPI00344EFBF1